jgi:hypothetical protein
VFASVATFVTLRFLQPVSKTIAKIDSHKESPDD